MSPRKPSKPKGTAAEPGLVHTPRRQGQRRSYLEDPAFRTRAIALASTGASRVAVAACLGIDHDTIYNWLERGTAQPKKEPWGSFAAAYRLAERGIEVSAARSNAYRVRMIELMMERVLEWVEGGMKGQRPMIPEASEFSWMLRLLERRYPKEWGISVHRLPESEPDPRIYFERSGLQSEQLRVLMRDPPDSVRDALIAEADAVFSLLLASGWTPPVLTQPHPEPQPSPAQTPDQP